MERCRLVRSGNKHLDEHCLPSTIRGEMEELINMSRRDNFLVYLQCCKLCEYYGIPLTEDVLMKGKDFGSWPLGSGQQGPEPRQGWHLPEVYPSPVDLHAAKLLWPVVGPLKEGEERRGATAQSVLLVDGISRILEVHSPHRPRGLGSPTELTGHSKQES